MPIQRKQTATLVLGAIAFAGVSAPTSAVAESRTFETVPIVICLPPKMLNPLTKRCTSNGRATGSTSTRVLEQKRFDRFRVERGVFSFINMNGIVQK